MNSQIQENNLILQKLTEQDAKIEKIYKSVEKTRKYFLFTLILSLLLIIVPIIALSFILPKLLDALSIYSNITNPSQLQYLEKLGL